MASRIKGIEQARPELSYHKWVAEEVQDSEYRERYVEALCSIVKTTGRIEIYMRG